MSVVFRLHTEPPPPPTRWQRIKTRTIRTTRQGYNLGIRATLHLLVGLAIVRTWVAIYAPEWVWNCQPRWFRRLTHTNWPVRWWGTMADHLVGVD